MQKLIFVRRTHGVSKKGVAYDMAEVSDGLSSFTLSIAEGVGEDMQAKLKERDEFMATVHVSTMYQSLRGTIVAFKAV